MTDYEALKTQMIDMVPFAKSIGVTLTEMGDGRANGRLELAPSLMNHIQTMHAGAMYSLGETVSGAAMTGAFADRMLQILPVAAEAAIKYTRKARGGLSATGRTDDDGQALRDALDRDGKIRFPVHITFTDETGEHVGEMTVEWAVKKLG